MKDQFEQTLEEYFTVFYTTPIVGNIIENLLREYRNNSPLSLSCMERMIEEEVKKLREPPESEW